MKTIIAGTDFTAASVNACEYAAFLAQKLSCKLTLFNLFEAPILHSNSGLYGITFSAQKNTSDKKTERLANQLKAKFPKLKIDHFISFGGFKQELEDFISQHQIEAAVMGLEAKDKFSKFIYGSHSIDIAGKLNCPVIIVPSRYKKHSLSNVLLSVDNNEKLYKPSLKGFEDFIKKSKTKLSLLHVRTEDEIIHPLMFKLKINAKNLPIETIEAGDIQEGVKKYCNSNSIDLVAMISRKHSAFYNLFVESNTKKIAFAAKVPVMAIHE
jgi:nucleotide-binding universal stress UspA family protein